MKLRSAQLAWISYRDAFLEAMWPAADKRAEYGTLYAMQYGEVRSQLTRQHTAALRDLISQHNSR